MSDKYSKGFSREGLAELWSSVSNFKKAVWTLFGPYSKRGLNTLKFHLLYRLMNDLELFITVLVLSTSPKGQFNFIVKQAYVSTSKR